MTNREDIAPNQRGWRRLSYTCRCGWVDWGHALPGGALDLKRQIDTEFTSGPDLGQMNVRLEGAPAYIVNYGQEMGFRSLRLSTSRHWVVRKGLTLADRRSVALAIFMSASMEFESVQGRFPFSIATSSSSFSAEDLISNVIGFHAAFDSISQERMRLICGEVSVDECYRLWDEHLPGGLGALKNRGLQPIRFECPECDGTQSDTSFPAILSSIHAAPAGVLWTRVKGRFIDGRLVNSRVAIDVSRHGDVAARRAPNR